MEIIFTCEVSRVFYFYTILYVWPNLHSRVLELWLISPHILHNFDTSRVIMLQQPHDGKAAPKIHMSIIRVLTSTCTIVFG